MLTLEGIIKNYRGQTVLNHVDLQLEPGASLALVGESGSGKTTLAKIILGLERADGGQVIFQGRPLANSIRQRSFNDCVAMQYIQQDSYGALEPLFTVGQVLAEAERICRRRRHVFLEGWRALTYVDPKLTMALGHFVGQLSGGQRQKLCIARALIPQPHLIVADEVTSMLDKASKEEVLQLFLRISREQGVTLLMIEHDLSLVSHRLQEIAVLWRGRIWEQLPANCFFKEAIHPYSRKLLAAHHFLSFTC